MSFVIRDPKQQLTSADLDAFEARNSLSIPGSYRRFLLEHNSGWPEPGGFDCSDGTRRVVYWFFGIDCGEYSNLDGKLATYYFRKRIPQDLFPIANDPFGNLILMGMPGPREGKVYFWDHNWEAERGHPPVEDNIFFVANSLDELLKSLSPPRNIESEGVPDEDEAAFIRASKDAGLEKRPEGYTWHYHDVRTLILVPLDLHEAVPHAGPDAVMREKSRNLSSHQPE
jgi:SMI1-KNR4 cell-wall/A nuclease of the HNH/ENDO VII superfamily with conserved WHH